MNDSCRSQLDASQECRSAAAAMPALRRCQAETDPERGGNVAMAFDVWDKAQAAVAAATRACPSLAPLPAAPGAALDRWGPSGNPSSWLPQVKAECARLSSSARELEGKVGGAPADKQRMARRELAAARASLARCNAITAGGQAALAISRVAMAGQALERVRRLVYQPGFCVLHAPKSSARPSAIARRTTGPQLNFAVVVGCSAADTATVNAALTSGQSALSTAIARLAAVEGAANSALPNFSEELAAILDRLHTRPTDSNFRSVLRTARTRLQQNLSRQIVDSDQITRGTCGGWAATSGTTITLCNNFFAGSTPLQCRAGTLIHEFYHVLGGANQPAASPGDYDHSLAGQSGPDSRLPTVPRVNANPDQAMLDNNELAQLVMQIAFKSADPCDKSPATVAQPEIEHLVTGFNAGAGFTHAMPLELAANPSTSCPGSVCPHVLLYNQATGAAKLVQINTTASTPPAGGAVTTNATVRWSANLGAGFTQLAPLFRSPPAGPFEYLRYKSSTGVLELANLGTGSPSSATHTWPAGVFGTALTAVVPLNIDGRLHVLRYNKASGLAAFHKLDGTNLTNVGKVMGWSKTYDQIFPVYTRATPPFERNGLVHLVLYAKSGASKLSTVSANGTTSDRPLAVPAGRELAPAIRNGAPHLFTHSGGSAAWLRIDPASLLPTQVQTSPAAGSVFAHFFLAGRSHIVRYQPASGTMDVDRLDP